MSFLDKMKAKADEMGLKEKAEHLAEEAKKAAAQAKEKAGEYADQNRDKIAVTVDKVGGKVNERTDGKYSDKIEAAKGQVAKGVDKLAEQKPDGTTGAAGAAGAAGTAAGFGSAAHTGSGAADGSASAFPEGAGDEVNPGTAASDWTDVTQADGASHDGGAGGGDNVDAEPDAILPDPGTPEVMDDEGGTAFLADPEQAAEAQHNGDEPRGGTSTSW